MADSKPTTIDLDPSEVALIVGEEGGAMTVRVVAAEDLPDDAAETPEPHEIAIALAMRLLKDPEFHDAVLDWYYAQPEEDDDEDGDEDEAELVDPPAKPKA